MRTVLIGGHGKVALLAAPLLTDAGHEVTSVIRNPQHAPEVERGGASALVLDVERADVADLTAAFDGADAVVFCAGAGGGNPARTMAVDREAAIRTIDAAAAAGVRRYVMVSYHGAGRVNRVEEGHPFHPYQEAKAAADAHLRESELDYTILGPGTLSLEPSPRRVAPATLDPEHPLTSRELVAEVILAVLDDPRAIGLTLDFHDGDLPIGDWIGQVAAGALPGAEG